MIARTSPCLTRCPSSKFTLSSVPSSRERICTVLSACTAPIPERRTGMSCAVTGVAETLTAEGPDAARDCGAGTEYQR